MTDTDGKEQLLAALRAAEWLQEIENPTVNTCAEFGRWLRSSPRHVRDILLATAYQLVLRQMKAHHRFDVETIKTRCALRDLELVGTFRSR